MQLEQFINEEHANLLEELTLVVKRLQAYMQHMPDDYTEHGEDTPAIDVRLCIDPFEESYTWIVRTGLVDFDPYHSEHCVASCVGLDTKPKELLEQLLGDLE
jgi:hypothetical protein